MIKRPWQIWTGYAACVIVVVAAMVWLTYTVWQLDLARESDRRATELARRDAELQERVSSALWRMDWLMIPLVAQEAARPYYMYRSFYQEGSSGNEQSEILLPAVRPSPILTQPSEFILLHFQIEPDNQFTSPQSPQGESRQTAMVSCGVSASAIEVCESRLAELQKKCTYDGLSYACPQDKLPAADRIDFPWQANELAAQVTRNMASPKQAFIDNNADVVEQQSQQAQQADAGSVALDAERQSASPIDELQKLRSSERGNSEFLQRDKAAQSYAKGQLNVNRAPELAQSAEVPVTASEGVMRPFWVGDLLIMARRVDLGGKTVIQGCWLDWTKIQAALGQEVADVLPGVAMQPVLDDLATTSAGRKMATLPVQLVDVEKCLVTLGLSAAKPDAPGSVSGLKLSLAAAWLGLVLGLAAIAVLLRGVIRLSERRAAFASAVTHELRTPLTTFRMYAEMLAERMVPSPEKQQQYARTMKIEADRLGHLVENVLRYARLERRNVATRAVSTTVGELFSRFENRLRERADQAGMQMSVELDKSLRDTSISTDPGTVEQIVFNLVDNACKYAASAPDKTIHLALTTNNSSIPSPTLRAGRAREGRLLSICIRDHGPGIDPRMSKRLFMAFSKSDQDAAETAQGVGLGLALCRRMATDLGGRLTWDKSYSAGASFTLTLPIT